MSKITSLTTEQIEKIPFYVKEWTNKGLTTERRTHSEAVKVFGGFQREILQRKDVAPIILLDSPTECWLAVLMFAAINKSQVWSQVWSQVESQVESQVWSQVWSQVESQVGSQVWSQVESQVGSQVRSQVGSQVWSQVWSQVGSQVWSQVESQVESQDIVYPYFDCQFCAGWFSFYEFCRNEIGIKFTNEKQYLAFLACQPFGMVWPLENVCVVCQPPTVIKKNNFGLHCENGPALSYNGQNEIYALNGVTVPKELVMTPSENLSIDFFKSEKNADIKAEFVRKYGVERMLDMGKLVDSYENYPDQTNYSWWWKSQYELWDMASIFPGLEYQPFLKMRNQTTGCWHVEAVSPERRTLKEAIKERFGNREMRIVDIA